MIAPEPNIDPRELDHFDALASRWWDPDGTFRTLHRINPLRLEFIRQRAPLRGLRVLDVGCGGGLLTEAMAGEGAQVTGIDMSEALLSVARLHLLESGLEVDYRQTTVEQFAAQTPGTFDVVTCLEMLEHVPDPASVVRACAALLRPGGHVFLSTLNRNPKSYLFAVLGAEYVLGLLPKGTHDYRKFIRPSELEYWMRRAGLHLAELTGLHHNPITGSYHLGAGVDVNYLVHGRYPADGHAR